MIHIPGKSITRNELDQVELKRPEKAGDYWMGVQHGELVKTIEEAVAENDWTIKSEKFTLSPDQADIAGGLTLDIPGITPPEGQDWSLGIIGSNARRKSLQLLVGTEIFICTNGMVSGEIVMTRRHTTGLDLLAEMRRAMTIYAEKISETLPIITGWQDRELSPADINEILVETGRQKILPWSRVGKVLAEFEKPTFGDFDEPTSWGLLNAFTYIVQQQPPLSQLEALNDFRKILPVAA